MAESLEPVARPDGRLYRPRKVSVSFVFDDDEESGVMVLGMHDVPRAKTLAEDFARCHIGAGTIAIKAVTGWWRDGFQGGRRTWIADEDHGRAGVLFRELAEG
jgi:hypothetical protein